MRFSERGRVPVQSRSGPEPISDALCSFLYPPPWHSPCRAVTIACSRASTTKRRQSCPTMNHLVPCTAGPSSFRISLALGQLLAISEWNGAKACMISKAFFRTQQTCHAGMLRDVKPRGPKRPRSGRSFPLNVFCSFALIAWYCSFVRPSST